MGSTKEIQTRMKSIQDTMKITNAMYMISSSKMQKAKKILQDTEPYFYNMQAAIARILRHTGGYHGLNTILREGVHVEISAWTPFLYNDGISLHITV